MAEKRWQVNSSPSCGFSLPEDPKDILQTVFNSLFGGRAGWEQKRGGDAASGGAGGALARHSTMNPVSSMALKS